MSMSPRKKLAMWLMDDLFHVQRHPDTSAELLILSMQTCQSLVEVSRDRDWVELFGGPADGRMIRVEPGCNNLRVPVVSLERSLQFCLDSVVKPEPIQISQYTFSGKLRFHDEARIFHFVGMR
jgi:hypothetical protein